MGQLTVEKTDQWTDGLADLIEYGITEQVNDCRSRNLINWLTEWMTEQLTNRETDQLIKWLTNQSIG